MTLRKKVVRGTLWSVFGQGATLGIALITNIWLARILSPNEFGQVGIIMFFVTLANIFVESGLGGALVRKQFVVEKDYSTVFVTNLVFSVGCFAIIYFSAGAIAKFYDNRELRGLLIVSSSVLVINAFQITQNAKMVREMRFKTISLFRFVAILVSSAIGIFFGYYGFGAWSLVLIQVLIAVFTTLLMTVSQGVFVKFKFSVSAFKEMYSFGINTTLVSLINRGFDNIYQLILAKYFSFAQTGYFYQAKKIQDVPGNIIHMVSQNVIFSALSKLQDDKAAFTRIYNQIAFQFLVLTPFVCIFFFVYSEPLVLLLYGDTWSGVIFYIQLLIIASFFQMQENVNRVIFKVFNRTRLLLYLEYFKKSIQAGTIIAAVVLLDINLLIYGIIFTNIVSYFINHYFSRKIIGSVGPKDLYVFIKVCIMAILIACILLTIHRVYDLNGSLSLITVPLLFGLYGLFIYIFRIGDLRDFLILLKSK